MHPVEIPMNASYKGDRKSKKGEKPGGKWQAADINGW